MQPKYVEGRKKNQLNGNSLNLNEKHLRPIQRGFKLSPETKFYQGLLGADHISITLFELPYISPSVSTSISLHSFLFGKLPF